MPTWRRRTPTTPEKAVTSAAVGTGFALDPFAMVSWHRGIELLVLGELAVHTDLHRYQGSADRHRPRGWSTACARPPGHAQLTAGFPAESDTRLDAGVVGAVASPSRSDRLRPSVPFLRRPARCSTPLAILDAATGGDWMEESLDHDGPRLAAAPLLSNADADDDPEMTLIPPAPAAARRR